MATMIVMDKINDRLKPRDQGCVRLIVEQATAAALRRQSSLHLLDRHIITGT
ncbi:MAG: hypothetical protein HGB06_07455 [Chlorobaculum sp.]|nr:hypothetical protein [Chlorobaculum sp.]